MSLTKKFFNRETNISAKVIADSISEAGIRITTLEVEAPRIILAEINTHNAISKNCSSSRAIPIAKMLKQVRDNGFTPLYWGKKQSGMQAENELGEYELKTAQYFWDAAKVKAIESVQAMSDIGLHKQIANRVTEPFQMVKQVLTATDWDNFYNLRVHPDAQPEILMLVYKMYAAMSLSKPQLLKTGEWHLPYLHMNTDNVLESETPYSCFYQDENGYTVEHCLTLEQALKYSASRCASVSYRTEEMTFDKAEEIFSRLLEADVLHSSPAEHQATPIVEKFEYLDKDDLDTGYEVNLPLHPDSWEDGITHVNRYGELCSANFRGWIQHRHTLKHNTCWNFDFEDRMKMFDN